MTNTRRMTERKLLGDALLALDTSYHQLRALVTYDEAAHDDAAAAIVEDWITELRELADVIDQAYGETFIEIGDETSDETGGAS